MKKLLLPLSVFALLLISAAAECQKIAEEELLKPTALSANTIAENQPTGTKIGDLTTTGGVAPFAYALLETGTGSDDHASFAIEGAILKTNRAYGSGSSSTKPKSYGYGTQSGVLSAWGIS